MRKLFSRRYGIPEHLLHLTLVFSLGIRILMDAAVMISIDFYSNSVQRLSRAEGNASATSETKQRSRDVAKELGCGGRVGT